MNFSKQCNKSVNMVCSMIFFVIFVLVERGDGFRLNTGNYNLMGTCEQFLKRAEKMEIKSVDIKSEDSLHGKWVSEGCETRPGPEFLLRSYTFYPNDTFKLVQHYYSDPSCTSPAYSVVARGRLRPPGLYNLIRVGVVPHNTETARQLATTVSSTCPDVVKRNWQPHKEYSILYLPEDPSSKNQKPFATTVDGSHKLGGFSNGNKKFRGHQQTFNCLHSLKLVFHELHSYKVRIRPGTNSDFDITHYRHELLLGDIHSRLDSRAEYMPTTYQVPLLNVDKSLEETLGIETDVIPSESLLNADAEGIKNTRGPFYEKSFLGHFDIGKVGELESIISSKVISEHKVAKKEPKPSTSIFKYCYVCSTIADSTEKVPPYLSTKPTLPLYISGEWVSLQCEHRPNGLYLTRHFRFYPKDHTWIVEYKYYFDTTCSVSGLSVTAAGHYKEGKANRHVPGGTEVDFYVERASLTVIDPHMMENLSKNDECGVGPWELGVPRELSSTHGCPILGFVVPSVEYDLLKLEPDFNGAPLLYMGQADTYNKRRGAKERPTAYQDPLIRCEKLPPSSETLKQILNSKVVVYNNPYNNLLALEYGNLQSEGHTCTSNFIFAIVCIFLSKFLL